MTQTELGNASRITAGGHTMRVYRVENAYGQGPYTGWGDGKGHNLAMIHTDNVHPGPWVSFHRGVKPDEKFAFPSMLALFRWFGGWLPVLIRDGFTVKVLDLPEGTYETDGLQVIYREVK